MATYNGGKYIKEQIDSILCQISTIDELIISDDGSKDETLEVINSYDDKRIILLHNQSKHGFVGNFENALKNAKGDIIIFSDQDDIWKPNKVKVVTDRLQHYDLIVHDADLIDGEGKPLFKTYYSLMHGNKGFWANLWKTRWLGCCMAFRRNVLDACIPFPKKVVGHDYWIGMLGMVMFKYCFINDVLISYRRHSNNVSTSSEKSSNSVFYMLVTKRLNILIAIACRMLRIFRK